MGEFMYALGPMIFLVFCMVCLLCFVFVISVICCRESRNELMRFSSHLYRQLKNYVSYFSYMRKRLNDARTEWEKASQKGKIRA